MTTKKTFASLSRLAAALMLIAMAVAVPERVEAQDPLEVTVAGAEFKPIPVAVAGFEAAAGLADAAANITRVLESDLQSSGLVTLVNRQAFLETPVFDQVPNYANWRTINADALVTGRVLQATDGRLQVQFRVFDAAAENELHGEQFLASPADWRRVAHKVADAVYSKLTGEGPYFDSRVVFVDETGPKNDRRKRLAIMDQDGANLRYLPGASGLVLTPRFSPNDQSLLYISYDSGTPQVFLLNLDTGQRERLGNFPGMSFAPRFSPSGGEVVLSLSENGNTDLYRMTLASRSLQRLTSNPAIDTAASYSPDGSQLVFESDRGGSQQLYVMAASGGDARRISFGQGNYGTPVWSPKGDLIAFTKILGGRFHIGVMRTDGSNERLLSTSFLDEGPTFAPNGRVLMFFRQSPGQAGGSQLMSIDVTGRNLKVVDTPNHASDPAWSPIRR